MGDPVDSIENSEVSAVVLGSPTSPGAVVDVRFTNIGERKYWFSPCTRTVERLVGDAWIALPDELRMCTAEVYFLRANGEVLRPTDVPLDATSGTYRFVFGLVPDTGPGRAFPLLSAPFSVR